MEKIIVESDELLEVSETVKMYADLLNIVDEEDIYDVMLYAAKLKEAADDLEEIADSAEPVKGAEEDGPAHSVNT